MDETDEDDSLFDLLVRDHPFPEFDGVARDAKFVAPRFTPVP
jgi:hypothetical protein